MKVKTVDAVKKNKIIVIVRGVWGEKLIPLAAAMYAGGIQLLELTFSADKSVSDNATAENIYKLKNHFGDSMSIGAGTVLTAEQVSLTQKAGGEFIISPNIDKAVIKETVRLEMVSMPGAFTVSEIYKAHSYGADFVKLFPVTSLGPDYVRAVKAPLPHIKMLAVGGITLDNIQEYIKCGVTGFGIGSNIIDKKMLSENNYEGITELAKKYVNAVGKE